MIEGRVLHDFPAFSLDVSFSMAPGEALGLFGPSGSGKSTTLRAMAGLVRPRAGRIVMGERVLFDSETSTWVPPHLRRVSYMPQHYGLFPHLQVSRNVAFGLRSWGRDAASRRSSELLSMLHIGELQDRYPGEISSGQQQRVALARALAPRPELLLLDEPFSALDQGLRQGLRRELQALRRDTDVPIILVTHDWTDVLALCDRVLVVEQGAVVAEGPPVEIFEGPKSELLSRLTTVENVFEGPITGADPAAGVMTCDIGGMTLEVPVAGVQPGVTVRVGIRAGDIILATEAPRGLSARNILQGRVISIEERGFEREVLVDCGQTFRVAVTPRAVETLAIHPGSPVWLVIKSNSCFLIE